VTETPLVARAVETTDVVSSHLHPEGSFDVADHPVPTGREETWRFTPLKRLRGLHADAVFTPGGATCTWNTPEGVRVELVTGDEARALRGISGLVPDSRFAARVLSEVPTTLLVDVPADLDVSEPIVVDLSWQGRHRDRSRSRRAALRGALAVRGRAQPHRLSLDDLGGRGSGRARRLGDRRLGAGLGR
jgi:Fe-S cluster assembly protein SufD